MGRPHPCASAAIPNDAIPRLSWRWAKAAARRLAPSGGRGRWAAALTAVVALGVGGCGDDDEAGGPGVLYGEPVGGSGAGDACAGVVCDEPPPPVCVAEDTLRTYAGQGRCIDGACVFDEYADAPCTDCCYGAEINWTGNPLGGGSGYADILDPSQATRVVSTAAGLIDALASAASGDVIYLEDDATIDLSGEEALEISAGVTLASGRGRSGSEGALITCDSYARPLFRIAGEGARVTGLRLRGPQPDILDHDYDLVPHSTAISSSQPSLEVDNCELWAWGTSAVSLGAGALDAHVHHSYIHHTRRAGLGYGVVLDQAEALIEGNVFDACRHHIAATGRVGTSYEAAFNLVLEHANGHGFDMHGARDYDKRETKAIWRFDEGQGDAALDSSIGLYHPLNHCTLTNMATATCWVAGQINTALSFDGSDDHLECGNDSSLLSDTGTIYFWVKSASLGQDADIVRLYEDTSANYLAVGLTAQNRVQVTVEDGGAALVSLTSDTTIADTSWHHVAVTQDGTSVAIYVDGQPSAVSGTNATAWSGHLSLAGAWLGGGPSGYFAGTLDEVRVYSRALTAEEVTLHQEGNPDVAGGWMRIHHNTFRDVQQSAVVIRGKPAEGADVHHNWFHEADPDHTVRQVNALGNLDVHDNHYGGDVPLGTVLPEPDAVMEPAFGRVPVDSTGDSSASFDPVGRIEAVHWAFGDGDEAWGTTASHAYAEPGRYLVRATTMDEAGIRASTFVPVKASPDTGSYRLDFWVKDSYPGPLTGFYSKQALVDGQLVWQDDVAENEGWQHVSVDVAGIVTGLERADVQLRVQNQTAVSNHELVELSVYWDDVELFGGTVGGGDFETSGAWSYEESSSSWSGRVSSAEPHSGDWAYAISYPYLTSCPAGAWAQITQSVPVTPPELLGSWRLDEGRGLSVEDRSLYGNHGVLAGADPTAAWQMGMMGTAVVFDGVDDVVDLGAAGSLSSARGTVMLWARLDGGAGEQALLELSDEAGDASWSLGRNAAGQLRVRILQEGAAVVELSTSSSLADGAFHHVALTQDGSGVRLYVDGAEATGAGSNGTAWTDHITVAAAQLGNGADGAFAGALDEITALSTALAADAIAAEYRRGFPLAAWSFDEGQGTVAADGSGNGHEGTLTNMDAASCWVTGHDGGALRFDGVDDVVDVANAASLASPEGTIELWLRPDVLDDSRDLINVFEDGFSNYLLIRRDDQNRITVRIEDDDQELVQVTSLTNLTGDDFHHVAITQDGTGVLVYVDGEVTVASGNNGPAWTDHLALTGMWIGGGHWSYFAGTLDEVRLHARALRPAEIALAASER